MRREHNQYKTFHYLVISILIILGLALFILGEYIEEYEFWSVILNNLGSTLLLSGVFGLLDQLILKQKLAEFILEKLKLKEEIDRTGIENIYYDIKDIDYKYYIKKAKKNLDIIHIYGRSWTTNLIDELKDKVFNSNCNIRVVLLSPDSLLIPGLAELFNYTEEELRNEILNSTKIWKNLDFEKSKQKRRKTLSNLTLYYHKGFPAYSLYRIDDIIIHVSNKLSRGRTARLPSFVIKNTNHTNDLFDIYLDQIENLIAESEKIDLSKT